mmetsp:Transcript_106728/g.297052  ORF Transcript_106728/g.297052 Transcript_106728/m.297052 type:complete len:295 (-) Transcript_106728:236-1120(-)
MPPIFAWWCIICAWCCILCFTGAHSAAVHPDNPTTFDFVFRRPLPDIPCGTLPAWGKSQGRVAVVVHGEAFRSGGGKCRGEATNVSKQLADYQSMVSHLILPLHVAGYEVDVFVTSYTTVHEKYIIGSLGGWLKNYQPFDKNGSSQALNTYASLVAFVRYAAQHQVWYQFMVVTCHDLTWRMRGDLVQELRRHMQGHTWLVAPRQNGVLRWCGQLGKAAGLFPVARWGAMDFLHVVDGTLFGCFLSWMHANNSTRKVFWWFSCPQMLEASLHDAGGHFEHWKTPTFRNAKSCQR